ncbi:hypothetical protein LINGRAHAP2_LOCUS19869 [Linum grandiflorum]
MAEEECGFTIPCSEENFVYVTSKMSR